MANKRLYCTWYRWLAELFCKEPRVPVRHSKQCVKCGRIFKD